MNIVIIGAGVGGLAAAHGLLAAGHDVAVYERGATLRTGGTGLILWSNGTGVLDYLDVPMHDLGSPLTAVDTAFSDGVGLWQVDMHRIEKHYEQPNLVIPRGDIVRRLAERLPAGVLRLGMSCTGFEEGSTDRPVALFEDGSRVEADLLIGADGNRSAIRRQLTGDETRNWTGFATWHGLDPIDLELASGTTGMTIYGPEGFSVLLPAGGGRLQWVFETPWKDGELVPPGAVGDSSAAPLDSTDPAAIVNNLRSRFGHWAEPIPSVLAAIENSEIGLFPHIRLQPPQPWSRGRVTMLGDAVHAIPPALAQGVNQVLEDVWVLCGQFGPDTVTGDPATVASALAGYEDICRRRLRHLDRYAAVMAKGIAPPKFLRHTRFPVTWIQTRTLRMLSDYLKDEARPPALTR